MKKYRVNVNGTVFEVEIEEMTGAPAAPAVAPAPAAPARPRRRRKDHRPHARHHSGRQCDERQRREEGRRADDPGGHEDGKRDHGALRRHRHLRVASPRAPPWSPAPCCAPSVDPGGPHMEAITNFLTSTGFYQFFQGENWKSAHYAGDCLCPAVSGHSEEV